ncbi:endonuclease MutS2 [mine drainage metagenome]|uniref:Endonuclease MutS2 n=1 Tax=mine drainage metagenome TaxID=410659 RepID=A0A1J5QWX0_9ZZZZ
MVPVRADERVNRRVSLLVPEVDGASGGGLGAAGGGSVAQPDFFVDLNLDQVVAAVTAGHEEYDLASFFWRPSHSVDVIAYRHEVFRDLEDPGLVVRVSAFADAMRAMRSERALSGKIRNPYQRQRWFVQSAATYVRAVRTLTDDLTATDLTSRGLLAVRDHVTGQVASADFAALEEDTRTVLEDLARVRYRMQITGARVRVSRYEGEADYSADVLACFEKFKQGDVAAHRSTFATGPELNHVEAAVLSLVVRLYPETFAAMAAFCEVHQSYLDRAVATFDREVHFFTAYLRYLAPLRAAGLVFSYPTVSARSTHVAVTQSFDLALAHTLVLDGAPIVRNDVTMDGAERVLVVTGPNQGGKTTFARMFGQLHYLAALGLPVPGTSVELSVFDRLFTHFEKQEDLSNLTGKLQDDLVRIHDLLERATASSIVILNEIFTSTTLTDAVLLGAEVLQRIIALGARCVCVTFIDELATLSDSTVSLMSTVEATDPTRRTFSIVRKPPDGLAYAAAVAEKYRLDYPSLTGRLTT